MSKGSSSVRWLLLTIFLVAGCSNVGGEEPSESSVADPSLIPAVTDPDPIVLSLSLYVVSEAGAPDSSLSSQRTTEEVESIAAGMSGIWAQADIRFDPVIVHEIDIPADVLAAITTGRNTDPFFASAGQGFDVPDPGLINGFYVRAAGGVNGFTTSGSRVFFVVDEPSVHDERVSSHEVGHIFGLHHDLADSGNLMFSGTNGMNLTEQETEVARYGAQGMLDGQR